MATAGAATQRIDEQMAVDPAGQVPEQPGVHGSEQELASLRLLARALHVLEDQRTFGPEK